MRKSIKIGSAEYLSKKEALLHYKEILNFYSFGESLSDAHFDKILDLLGYSFEYYLDKITLDDKDKVHDESFLESSDSECSQNGFLVKDVKVARVQYGTKCFELIFTDNTSQYISYLMIINNQEYTPEKLFSVSCRNVIQKDMLRVKQDYFKANAINGSVKCQETGIKSQWDDLVVDHRQPNTLSSIIERFKELCALDLSLLEYTSTGDNLIIFKDSEVTAKFIAFHAAKANLRLVRKGCNSSRSALARVKRNSKDLTVPDKGQLSLF